LESAFLCFVALLLSVALLSIKFPQIVRVVCPKRLSLTTKPTVPVAETQPHSLTQRSATAPYSCANGDRSALGYWAPARWFFPDGSFEMGRKFILHTMSRECRYDRSLTDPRCATCKHRGSGEEYSIKIRTEALGISVAVA
jgi:hypothetical protein